MSEQKAVSFKKVDCFSSVNYYLLFFAKSLIFKNFFSLVVMLT